MASTFGVGTGQFRTNSSGILSVFEAEHLVQALRAFSVDQVGSDAWVQQHDSLEKLNIQAHHNALSKHDEFVVDAFVSFDKVHLLIHEVVVIEVWKRNIFPLVRVGTSHLTALKLYLVLYHEATLVNLLEVLLYHKSVCEAAEESLSELVDYSYRNICLLNTKYFSKLKRTLRRTTDDGDSDNWSDSNTESDSNTDSDEDGNDERSKSRRMQGKLKRLRKALAKEAKREQGRTEQDTLNGHVYNIDFAVAVTSVSLMRLMSEHIATLPVSVTTRILETHDVIMSLVPLILHPPWTRRRKRNVEKFIEQKWIPIADSDRYRLTKTEGQVWLCLYNLVMDPESRKKYEFNRNRKEQLLTIKRYFHEILLDQIPNLRDLQRFIEELALYDPPAPTQSALVMIENLPEMRDKILAELNVQAVAEQQRQTFFSNDPVARQRDVARMAKTYDLDNFDEVMEVPVCANPGCGSPATNRCSRCKSEWYCSRKCQVKHWKAHKAMCTLLSETARNKRPAQSEQRAARDSHDEEDEKRAAFLIEEIDAP